MMQILVFEPNHKPYIEEIDGSLNSIQEVVDGHIEVVPVGAGIVIVCDKEFIVKAEINDQSIPTAVIGDDSYYGTFFLCREDESKLKGITSAQLNLLKEVWKIEIQSSL